MKARNGESTAEVDGRDAAPDRAEEVDFALDAALVSLFTAFCLLAAVFSVAARFALAFAVVVLAFAVLGLAVRLAAAVVFLAGAFCLAEVLAVALEDAELFFAAGAFFLGAAALVLEAAFATEDFFAGFFFAADLVPVFLPDDPAMSASLCVLISRRWTDRGLPPETGRARKLPEPFRIGHIA